MILRAAETAEEIVQAALTLFGGTLLENPDYTGDISFAGQPYDVPGTEQLHITGTEMGFGNALPHPDAFDSAVSLWERTHTDDFFPENACAARRYSFACLPCDRIYAAVQTLFALYIRRNVRKFILAVRNTIEREQVRQTISVYTAHFSDKYRCAPPVVQLYNSNDWENLRRYVCGNECRILLINRENFDRDANLMRRPCAYFSQWTPLSLLTPAAPVILTLSSEPRALRRFFTHTEIFHPLCTLSFLDMPDRTGATLPLYTGAQPSPPPEKEDGQLRLL